MCGRYSMDIESENDIRRVVDEVDPDIDWLGDRDVFPSEKAVIIAGDGYMLKAENMRWGFEMPGDSRGDDFVYSRSRESGKAGAGRRLLINARAETAMDKPTFSDSVKKRRCAIPATTFYEWDAKKNKVTFSLELAHTIFLAGFYRLVPRRKPTGSEGGCQFEDGSRGLLDINKEFVILTTAANESMAPVHDRMPLILPEENIRDWIFKPELTAEFLAASDPELKRSREFEQLSLF
ncbi:MAG: SOS response-associated peptidase family protein [Eubacteriales bacterium]|nr:SOS response-associated peptidase family protein [Eubacteriales bacterium]